MKKPLIIGLVVGSVLLALISAVYRADVTIGTDVQCVGYGLPFSWGWASSSYLNGLHWNFFINPFALVGNVFVYASIIMVLLALMPRRHGETQSFADRNELNNLLLITTVYLVGMFLVLIVLASSSPIFLSFFGLSNNLSAIFCSGIVALALVGGCMVLRKSRSYAS
jgi:uncharacterized membrane protein